MGARVCHDYDSTVIESRMTGVRAEGEMRGISTVGSRAAFVMSMFASLLVCATSAQADGGYKLPYDYATKQRVDQGWNQEPTHASTQAKYGYDFGMKEGTRVRAAQTGTVKFAK